jgi:DNA-binding response OmpR family regulator
VEDDASIARSLREGLERHGFTVQGTESGRDAIARAHAADLVLLDLGLPDVDGKEVCRQVRAATDVPLIVLTALSDEIDRVVLLELGADDYIVKPFGFRELVARIGAVTRRTARATATRSSVQRLGELTIDRDARRVFVDDRELELTPKEFGLLAMLAERPGAVRTREDIIDQVWDVHWFGPTKTLDVHISALRRKLQHPEWIATVRGVGYRLEAPA